MTDELRDEIEREFVVERTGWVVERVARVTERLQRGIAPADLLETLVVWWEHHNAFTTFGRTIYISRRLFERLPDDDAVAFVIAHELAHHRLGHIPRAVASRLLPARLVLAFLDRWVHGARNEMNADKLAIELCLAAGYDLDRCLATLEILALISFDYGDVDGVLGSARRTSHPALNDRIASVRTHATSGGRVDIQHEIARERDRKRRTMVTALGGVAAASVALLVLRRWPR